MGLKWYLIRFTLGASLALSIGCDNAQPLIDAADVKVESLTQNGTYLRVDGASLSWFETAKIEDSLGSSIDASISMKGDDYLILQINGGLASGGTGNLVVGQSYIIVLDAGLKTPFRSEPITLSAGAAPAVGMNQSLYYVNQTHSVSLSGSCSIDAQPVQLTLTQGGADITGTAMCSSSVWSISLITTGFAEGSFSIQADFTDGTTSAVANATGYIDSITPVLSGITGVPSVISNQPSIIIGFNFVDASLSYVHYEIVAGVTCPASIVAFTTVSSPGTYATPTISLPAADGTYTACIYARDDFGNVSSMQSYTWQKDTTAPSFTAMQVIDNSSSAGYVRTLSGIRFVATGSYTESTVWLEVFDDASCGGAPILAHTQLVPGIDNSITLSAGADGTRSVSARMTDAAGNVSTCTATNFIVDLTAPIISSFNLNGGDLLSPKRIIPIDLTYSDATSGADWVEMYTGSGCAGATVVSDSLPLVSPTDDYNYGQASAMS